MTFVKWIKNNIRHNWFNLIDFNIHGNQFTKFYLKATTLKWNNEYLFNKTRLQQIFFYFLSSNIDMKC